MHGRQQHSSPYTQTRTILQFRTIDFGMESCQLVLRLPALDDSLPDPFNFHGEDGVAVLDVCELEADDLLDLPKLTWASRPSCRKNVGTFVVTPGGEASLPQFPCKWASLHSFEVSCSPHSPDCSVDVWSSQHTTWGKWSLHQSCARQH